MSSWEGVFRFLVAFGGGCVLFAGTIALLVWVMYKIDERSDKL